MSQTVVTRRALAATVAVLALGALAICMEQSVSAVAQSTATITPSLSPNRLDAKGSLTLTIVYAGITSSVPSPARRALLRFPAGLHLEIPALRSCSAARLRAHGAGDCPVQSKIGYGQALVESNAGSQFITEHVTLSVFLGPLQNFQPTFEVLGVGSTPLQQRIVLSGTVVSDHAPYGEALVMHIPPIPTLPLEPDASLAWLTLTVGTTTHRMARDANTVVVPERCPTGGFPFAGEFTYADGSTSSALATALCPQ